MKEILGIQDLLTYINDNYILEDRFNDDESVKESNYQSRRKKMQRILNKLENGKDYYKEKGRYYFTNKQAWRLLYRNSELNNHFLKEMIQIEDSKDFKAFFSAETARLNEENKEHFIEYMEFMEYKRDVEYEYKQVMPDKKIYWPLYDLEDQKKRLLLDGLGVTVESIFDHFMIDGDAYGEAFDDMNKLINTDDNIYPYRDADETADYPYNESYGYHYFRLMRPHIYYRKDSIYLTHLKKKKAKKTGPNK